MLRMFFNFVELEDLVGKCGRAMGLQALEAVPDFTPEENKDLDFVKLHDEGKSLYISQCVMQSPNFPTK